MNNLHASFSLADKGCLLLFRGFGRSPNNSRIGELYLGGFVLGEDSFGDQLSHDLFSLFFSALRRLGRCLRDSGSRLVGFIHGRVKFGAAPAVRLYE